MKGSRTAVVCLLIAALGIALISSAYAQIRVTNLGGSDPYGWMTHSSRCWGGKGGILSYYNGGARNNPGPAPGGCLGFETPENGTTGGTDQPGQSWTGTDRYAGVMLKDIKKISYWAIVDWRGPNSFPLLDSNGNDVYNTVWDPRPPGYPEHWREWRLQSMSSQPPAIVLIVIVNGTDYRTLLYRPWSSSIAGFGPSAVEFKATGTARIHRIWQKYVAVDTEEYNNEGLWYVTESIDPNYPYGSYGMYTWDEILQKYPDAFLATPIVNANCVFNSDPAQAPIPCSFSLHMGALANSNPDWASIGKSAWWYESYWARGCADLVTFKYDADPGEGEDIVEETFDFDVNATEPPSRILALNNFAVFDQNVYMPVPRTRVWSKPADVPWGGGTVINAGLYPWNAVQRYGHYGTSFEKAGGVTVPNSTRVNLFVLYGKVCDDPAPLTGADQGLWFYLDDGAGKKIKCYCSGPLMGGEIQVGDYVRMVGGIQGNNPFEWYYNEFHIVGFRDTYPFDCPESQPWPWEFQTFPWQVTKLVPGT